MFEGELSRSLVILSDQEDFRRGILNFAGEILGSPLALSERET